METNIEEITSWLNEQVNKNRYAEIGVKFIIHEGKVKRIEKSIVEKSQ